MAQRGGVMASAEVVLVDVADRVGVITLNRPEQRNALNRADQEPAPEGDSRTGSR